MLIEFLRFQAFHIRATDHNPLGTGRFLIVVDALMHTVFEMEVLLFLSSDQCNIKGPTPMTVGAFLWQAFRLVLTPVVRTTFV